MQTPQILSTKLYVPPTRSRLVERPHLFELIEHGVARKLTLISAPAGFGKTTLLAEWYRQSHRQSALAWLSLDEGDNDLVRFLGYLVAAIRPFTIDQGEAAQQQLYRVQPLAAENVLTALINSVTAFFPQRDQPELILVLDDYHMIGNQAVNAAIAFLLEHMPPQMHLVIASRLDPMLPLHRLRVRDQLVEVRAAQLRFSQEEVAEFINGVSGLSLPPENLAQLAAQIEGWVAGLQLAALSLKGVQDSTSFIKAFSTSNRFILEYLAEEVLSRQSAQTRTFLLQTSLLDRFNAKLVEAVTGQPCRHEDLVRLEQANLFLIPLDDHAEWYRYHNLFAEFLRHRLGQEQPEQWIALHQRASQWFEKQGWFYEAVQHALAAPDFELAARLIEEAAWPLIIRGEYALLDDWLQQIPLTTLYQNPDLCLCAAWEKLFKGQAVGYEKLLEAAEQHSQAENNRARLERIAYLRGLFTSVETELLPVVTTNEKAGKDWLAARGLSDRELEVLQLIAAGATNQEIADQLVITLSTVKKHTTSIFSKLDVTSRTQALLRAKEMSLSVAPPESQTTNLRIWTIGLKENGSFAKYMNDIYDSFKKLHPNLNIQWENFEGADIQFRLLEALATGDPPDLINLNTNFALKFASKGILEDIGRILTPTDRAKYLPNLLEATRIGESLYSLPWYLTVPITMINKDLFIKAGFDPRHPPRTFDEVLRLAKILHDRTGAYAFQPITSFYEDGLMEGFPILSPDRKKSAFNTPAALEKLSFYENLKADQLIPPNGLYYDYETVYDDAVSRYKSGRLAMLLVGGSLLSQVEKDAPEVYRNTIIAPHLLGKSGLLPAQLMNLAVLKSSKNKTLAFELALFLTNDVNQLAFDKLAVILPSTVKASQDRLFDSTGDLKQDARRIMAHQLKVAREVALNTDNYIHLTQVLQDHLRAWWQNGKPGHQALADASDDWNILLGRES